MRVKADKRRRTAVVVGLTIMAALLAPIAVYVATFGWRITDDHGRWGEMGSAMSGIYTPILSILTLVLVARQYIEQVRFNGEQASAAYIANARSDLSYYLEAIHKQFPPATIGLPTHPRLQAFQSVTLDDLRTDGLRQNAEAMDMSTRALANWSAVYSILMGLSTNQEQAAYRLAYTSAKQRVANLLTWWNCAALDNAHFAMTQGAMNIRYEFSTLLKNSLKQEAP